MKTMKNLLFAGVIATTTALVGCGTPRVGPAETTLAPMENVGQVRSVKRTTVVSTTGTNITMVEVDETPTAAQKELRLEELRGNREAAVAQANRPVVVGNGYPTYGFVGGGYSGYPTYTPSGGGYCPDNMNPGPPSGGGYGGYVR